MPLLSSSLPERFLPKVGRSGSASVGRRVAVSLLEAISEGVMERSGRGFALFGELGEGAVAEPAEVCHFIAVCGTGDLAMASEVDGETALRDAGGFEGVDVAVEEGERDGTGEEGAGVLKLVVEEERDGDEAGGGGLGEVACPLVHADGASDVIGGGGAVGLGVEGRSGDEKEGA